MLGRLTVGPFSGPLARSASLCSHFLVLALEQLPLPKLLPVHDLVKVLAAPVLLLLLAARKLGKLSHLPLHSWVSAWAQQSYGWSVSRASFISCSMATISRSLQPGEASSQAGRKVGIHRRLGSLEVSPR